MPIQQTTCYCKVTQQRPDKQEWLLHGVLYGVAQGADRVRPNVRQLDAPLTVGTPKHRYSPLQTRRLTKLTLHMHAPTSEGRLPASGDAVCLRA